MMILFSKKKPAHEDQTMTMTLFFTVKQFNIFQKGEPAYAKAKDELVGMHTITVTVNIDDIVVEELDEEDYIMLRKARCEYVGDIVVTRKSTEISKKGLIDITSEIK